jgi:hypothetical protein
MKGKKNFMNKNLSAFIAMTAFLSLTWMGTASADEDSTIITKVHGYASFEAGEAVKGWSYAAAGPLNHDWIQTAYRGICYA